MAQSITLGQTRLDQATVERARGAVSLTTLVARRVKLSRCGREWKGLCPFHQEKTPSFNVVESKGFYHCFGCGAHGDAIRWLQEVEGLDFRAAVQSLLGGELPDARRPARIAERTPPERPQRFDCVDSATAGRWIWRSAFPARGEVVEAYLRSRGLDPDAQFLGPAIMVGGGYAAIDQLRFHPRCPASVWRVNDDPRDARLTAPAMVAPISDAEGAVWGVHVTYLAHDGRSKARFPPVQGRERPTRKMFGKVGGNAVFLTGPHPDPLPQAGEGEGAPLIVGEGIETVWAFAQGFGRPCRVLATLSLENLQGGAIRLRDGSLPLWNVQADPARSPFTLSPCGSPANQPRSLPGDVIILVDADMKPLRDQKLQRSRGARPERGDLSGLERAEICAALATQAWRRAGASSVRAVRPRMGADFNDQVRGLAA